MAYSIALAERVRKYLEKIPELSVEEKKMFGGLAFMVNGKMCINIGEEYLMCRYNPALEEEVKQRKGYLPLEMRGKFLKGYCYVEEQGYKSTADFRYWIHLCLDYNKEAKPSKK